MDKVCCRLTVFFENPFWVGVFERTEDDQLSVCKVRFGAEPKEADVLEFILNHYYELKFSSMMSYDEKTKADSYKRRQRDARRQLQTTGIGTKSQQALQMQREEMKIATKVNNKEQRETKKSHLFDMKQQKKKEKRKGH